MKKFMYIFFILINTFYAREITIAIGQDLPPYVIQPSKGMEYEIIKSVFEEAGYTLKVSFVPFGRLLKSAQNRSYDAVATVNSDREIVGMYLSDTYITYENVLIGLKKSQFSIEDISDLYDKSIIAFKDANIYLGDDFRKMSNLNKLYKEVPNQEGQVASLFSGRIDLILLDKNIFLYHLKNSKLISKKQDTIVYNLFPPTHYSIAFKNSFIRNEFNTSLIEFKKSGKYDYIIKKYIGE